MKNVLEYKGYCARIEYSAEDQVLYGKIEGINDLVNFESDKVDEIENEFRNAVDDYLKLCEELGQTPDKAYSGSFNVRINPALHREISMQAIRDNVSLNNAVEKAIQSYVNDSTSKTVDKIWDTLNDVKYAVNNAGRASAKADPYINAYKIAHSGNKAIYRGS